LPQIGEKIGMLIADSAKIGAETLASVLNGFLEQLLKTPNSSRFLPYLVYWGIVAILIVAIILLFRRLFSRKIRL
ncbi:MAG: hypothetical protein LBE12_08345, partial [Planctomycetaceae bacterium]|jgi:uncharacterized membrane protein|nr:hypothetical protein [Planctomycetaceae bacterium]